MICICRLCNGVFRATQPIIIDFHQKREVPGIFGEDCLTKADGRWNVETREQRLDGTPIIIDGDYICLYDEHGRITGHFGVQEDITETKTGRKSLAGYQPPLGRYH